MDHSIAAHILGNEKKKKAHLLGANNFGETSRISLAAVLTTGF